jgi:cell wall-associated NlpC family hydrolase
LITILVFTGCSKSIKQIEVSNEQASEALNIALAQKDKPYEWGGRGDNTFDCSGLITWSYKQVLKKDNIFRVGDSITDDATMDDLYNWNVTMLPLEKIDYGDIVFISNKDEKVTHGGLFIEWIDEKTFKFINASSYYEKVVVDTWSLEGKKRGQWFVGAGRLKTSFEY